MVGPKKLRIAVLFGGNSGEHEVSVRSAVSVFEALDRERFEVTPIYIDREGVWRVSPPMLPDSSGRVPLQQMMQRASQELQVLPRVHGIEHQDVLFPLVHGTTGEDGALPGFFELLQLPYVGCGILASAVSMDKEFAKRLVSSVGVPVVPSITLRESDAPLSDSMQAKELIARISKELGFPCFVKAVNQGSSVGVYKVSKPEDFLEAMRKAFQYDTKVLIERAIEAREIELAVLEARNGAKPRVSVAGEIVPTHEYYSYEAKYLDADGAQALLPAPLSQQQMKTVQDLAAQVFQALECEGMARVDFFLERGTGQWFFNEINTIPGFTSISMYPKMWEASGLNFRELLTELVELAVSRHERRSRLKRTYIE
jgi:D-alanine-D-alanine ligase